MKIAVDIGHNTNFDGGAVGILSENTCAMAVGTLLIQKLIKAGHQVVDVLPRGPVKNLLDSLSQRTNKANDFGADIYVCIHFNAGKGAGSMVLYKSERGKALGQPVLNELTKAIGTKDLGMQLRDNLYVLNQSNMPAFLVECLFVDTQSDVDKYNPEKIAEAIFKGITGKASITPAPAQPPVPAERVVNLMQDIKNFQMCLNTCGFTNANGAKLDIDGFVGENTLAATKKMQVFIDTNIIKKKA